MKIKLANGVEIGTYHTGIDEMRIRKFVQRAICEEYGALISTDYFRFEWNGQPLRDFEEIEIHSEKNDSELVVFLPDRVQMLYFPFTLIEHEFARAHVDCIHTVPSIQWINLDGEKWQLLVCQMEDALPKFHNLFASDAELENVCTTIHPTDEVLQRIEFLRHHAHELSHDLSHDIQSLSV